MPELPEVETVVRGLQGPILNRTFTNVSVKWANIVQTPIVDLKVQLPGQKVEKLTRRGKYLQFKLSRRQWLFIHLKMSGSLLVEPKNDPLHKHIRVVFGLDNGYELRFKDMRKFGRIYLVDDPLKVIGKLGPEPLLDTFTVEAFKALFKRRTGRLKPLLLNQSFIAGIGNIYADEGCFKAKIHPQRSANTLSETELERLYEAIRQVLTHGIMLKGASFDEVYRGGAYQNHFQVYGRKAKPCPICNTPIKRIILGGRSTHFCPKCQPLAKVRN